ncbi:hypothetical protein [Streptomyces sp. NPDC088733]|uniref:hypothetical protein n=1 Tax=Streptomyces sp. NPDC088733 TaxID=3365880 RepID=UPI0037F9A964
MTNTEDRDATGREKAYAALVGAIEQHANDIKTLLPDQRAAALAELARAFETAEVAILTHRMRR